MPGHAGGGHSGGGGHMGGGHSSHSSFGGSHSSHSSFGGSHSSHSSFGGGPRGGMGGPMGGGPRPGPRPFFGGPRYYGGYYGPGYRRRGSFGIGLVLFIISLICLPIIFLSFVFHSTTDDDYDYNYGHNTYEVIKLTPEAPYDTNNVIDQTGEVVNESVLSNDLQAIYDQTGVQPYILVVDNQNNQVSENNKENYSNTYYDNNITVENGLLITYYYSEDSDSYDVYYTLGYDTDQVFDSDEMDDFYYYLDDNWNYDNADETEAFYKALTYTVDDMTIVDESGDIETTPAVVEHESFFQKYKKGLIALGAALIALVVVLGVNKRKKAKESESDIEDLNQYYNDTTDDNDTYSSTK